jgi:hypothetical protein
MRLRILVVVVGTLLGLCGAFADSLDGVYKGTKEYPADSPDWCFPKSIPLTFQSAVQSSHYQPGGQVVSPFSANSKRW